MVLHHALARDRTIRAVGFDDAPFDRGGVEPVHVAGVVCAGTRFEGMVWTEVVRDGWDATDAVIGSLATSKFLAQVHLVLLDGIAFGGFNVVDLPRLHDELGVPCVAVMRRAPDMAAIERALQSLEAPSRRLATIHRAGDIHHVAPFHFQVVGAEVHHAAEALHRITDTGHVPEPLRLAHLIGAAVKTGESGRRA